MRSRTRAGADLIWALERFGAGYAALFRALARKMVRNRGSDEDFLQFSGVKVACRSFCCKIARQAVALLDYCPNFLNNKENF